MKHSKIYAIAVLLLSFTILMSCNDKKPQTKPKAPAKVAPKKVDTHKADSIAAVKAFEAQKAAQKKAVYKNPYHIIIGSYVDASIAKVAFNKIKKLGFNPYYVSRFNGKYTAVAIASYPNIHQAYNKLYEFQDDYGYEEAWILFQEKK
ncbi:MAG: hypothetical protein QM486_11210 [Flavobacteriaceae bacterium]